MKRLQIILIIFTGIIILAFLVTIGLFTANFWGSPISADPKDWTNTLSFYVLLFPALLTCLNFWLILKVSETNSLIAEKNLTFQKHKDKLLQVNKILDEYEQLLKRVTTSFFDPQLPDNIWNMNEYLRRLFKYHISYFSDLPSSPVEQKNITDTMIDLRYKTDEYNDLKESLEYRSDATRDELEERNKTRREAQELRKKVNDDLWDIHDVIIKERENLLKSINS